MDHSTGMLLYQDRPEYGQLVKLTSLIPVGLLLGGAYSWSSGEAEAGLVLFGEAFIIGLMLWVLFPRAYEVFEDHLRIVLGGPFSVKVAFENTRAIRITSKTLFTMNFVTRMTKSYVEIERKKGPSIAITPAAADSFVENANRALEQWARTKHGNAAGRFW